DLDVFVGCGVARDRGRGDRRVRVTTDRTGGILPDKDPGQLDCEVVEMADVMGGASAGGDGGDDGRWPNKDNENSWYKCHMVDAFGNVTTEKW
ncbi:hypothetical protein LINPERHAP1_LOCUS33622, partial [Linum perenne]